MTRFSDTEIIGSSAIVISVSFRGAEFFRAGYFVSVNYEDPDLQENPYPLQADKLLRRILVEKPRVVQFSVDWNEIPESNIIDSQMKIEPISDQNESLIKDEDYLIHQNQSQFQNFNTNHPLKLGNIERNPCGYLNLFLNSNFSINPEEIFGFERNYHLLKNFQDIL